MITVVPVMAITRSRNEDTGETQREAQKEGEHHDVRGDVRWRNGEEDAEGREADGYQESVIKEAMRGV